MKLYKLMLIVALATAVVTAGCGGSEEEQKPGVPGSPGVPGITAPINGTIPTGCYNNGYSNCAPCPTGYLQSGGSCILNNVGNNTQCPLNTTWNGYSCMPSGFGNCPSGTTFDQNSAGCGGQGYNVPSYQNYTCYPIDYRNGLYYYSCQWVQYAPASGYYYNGYGWLRW